jgi:diguanylate cyclase (GGDEF)-like protein/PAS domain S-box-containing protein
MLEKQIEFGEGSFAREALRRVGEETFRRLAEAVGSAIFVCQDNQIRYVNRVAQTISGYTREELLTKNFGELIDPDSLKALRNRESINPGAAEPASPQEINIRTRDGATRCLAVTSAPIWFAGEFAELVTAFDITESKRIEEQAQLLAMTDPLTALGNYRKILSVLNSEIERSARTGRSFALVLLDVDEFKQINDHFGHLQGNRTLCHLGDVALSCCRAIDTVARYGGDEFCIILPETSAEDAKAVAIRIREELARDWELPLSVSAGVVAYPQDGQTIESLIESADRRLYRMKGDRSQTLPFTFRQASSHPRSRRPIPLPDTLHETSAFKAEFQRH